MATILTKKKDTTGAPSAGDLTNSSGGAELAVNTADKRLYTKDSGGNVVEVGINPTSITTGTLNTSGAVVFNDAGADVDFRVEGDTDANLLFVDAGNDRVGVGTSSPSYKFHVNGVGYFSGNIGLNTAPPSGQSALKISSATIFGQNAGGTAEVLTNAFQESGGDYKYLLNAGASRYNAAVSQHIWYTAGSGTAGNTITWSERMRIDSSGNLLVGTTSSNGRITGQSSTSDSSSFAFGTKNSSSTDLFRVRGDGALYLGLAGSSPYNLTTGSSANAYLETNGYLYRSTSSRKYKTQIEDIDASRSQAILNFRPVWYRSLCKDDNKSWSYYGLIAEEVAEIEPRLVFWGYNENDYEEVTTETPVERERTVTDEDGNETTETYTDIETRTERKLKEDAQLAPEGVQYDRLTVLLLDVVKRQDASIKALEARIAALENA